MIGRLLLVSLIAGAAAGALATIVQALVLTPMILEAEHYESGAAHAHAHGAEAGRFLFTALANLIVGVGFALLLNAAATLRGGALDARRGVLWGLAGFAAFSLAPALGLPPELPGAEAAELGSRQLWWLGAAAATAAGLALLVFGRGWALKAAGVAVIALPHLIGAPTPEKLGGTAPPELAAHFAVASLAAAALFWAALGGVSGLLRQRRWA